MILGGRCQSAALCRLLLGCCLLTLSSCQTAPHAECHSIPRCLVAARQVLTDTATELAHHPVRSGSLLVSQSGDRLQTLRAELGAKRPWTTHEPECLVPDAGKPLQPAKVQLFLDGAEALTALDTLIDQATVRIDVLMFLWDNDPVGWDVARRLAARAGPHLPVRVLVDGGGNLIFGLPTSATTAEVNRVIHWLARQPYVEVVRTHNGFARFDHRKLVLVDGRAAWSGGRNFTQESFFGQHDLSFVLHGPLAQELAGTFEKSWKEEGGRAPSAGGEAPCLPPDPNAWARLVRTDLKNRTLAEAIYTAVDRAHEYVLLENVYFSDARLVAELVRAKKRGVDVRVVLTIDSNSCIFNAANRATANCLRRAGVHVYLYPGMTHVKGMVVDGIWAYLGTGNFDPLSMRHDCELGLAIGAGPLIEEIEERVLRSDCRPEWELQKPLPVSVGDHALECLASWVL